MLRRLTEDAWVSVLATSAVLHMTFCPWYKTTTADIRTQLLGIWLFPPVEGEKGGLYDTPLKICLFTYMSKLVSAHNLFQNKLKTEEGEIAHRP